MTNFNIEVQKCVEILNSGGIILYPTDTIYGIGSDSHNNQAIDRINKLKGSDSKKPLIHLGHGVRLSNSEKTISSSSSTSIQRYGDI